MFTYVFVDCETGGLTTDYSLLSLACVRTDTFFNIEETHEFNFKLTSAFVTPFAIRLNGTDISTIDQNTASYQDALDVLSGIDAEKRVILAGWNVQFDARFIEKWVGFKAVHRLLDIQSVYRMVFPDQSASLEKAASFLETTNTPNHTAIDDVMATIEIARKLALLVRK